MLRMGHRIATTNWEDVGPIAGDYSDEAIEIMARRYHLFRRKASEAVSLVVDNVCDFYADSERMEWDVDEHFPNPMPFSPLLLIEWRNPTKSLINGQLTKVTPGYSAFLIQTFLKSDDDNPEWINEDTKWLSHIQTCMFAGGKFLFTDLNMFWQFNAAGSLCGAPNVLTDQKCMQNKQYADFVNVSVSGEGNHIALLAMSFANCKNVTRTELTGKEVEPDRPWVRKHNPPQIKYHVLNINPMRDVLRTEGRSDEVGIQKALHLCRGHFASYSEERPLFGKYAGQFWIPQHVKGKADKGVVLKDYKIGNIS